MWVGCILLRGDNRVIICPPTQLCVVSSVFVHQRNCVLCLLYSCVDGQIMTLLLLEDILKGIYFAYALKVKNNS
jgi:hypothetical protein